RRVRLMTSPARQPTPTVFSPLAESHGDGGSVGHHVTEEVRAALRHDQAELHREVILWQRWIRLAVLVVLVVAAIALENAHVIALGPLILVSIVYAMFVFMTGWAVQYAPDSPLAKGPWLPPLLVTADLVMLGSVVFMTM